MTADKEAQDKLYALVRKIDDTPANELGQSIEKIAEVLDEYDKLNGHTAYYGTRLQTPNQSIYTTTMKEANEMLDNTIMLHKHAFQLDKLAEIDAEVYSILGDDVASDLTTDGKGDRTKLANVLPTLPLPDKRLLEEHLFATFS